MEKITGYFPSLALSRQLTFDRLVPLYKEWNKKINIISRKDIDNIFERHILHSLSITKYINFPPGSGIIDAGTGGGFPGIPLAVFYPESHFFLVDSVGKKIKVIGEICKAEGINNVTLLHENIRDIKFKCNFITGRSVCNFPEFVKITQKNLVKEPESAIIYLKGGDFEEEIKPYKNNIQVFNISDLFSEDYFASKKIIVYKPFI